MRARNVLVADVQDQELHKRDRRVSDDTEPLFADSDVRGRSPSATPSTPWIRGTQNRWSRPGTHGQDDLKRAIFNRCSRASDAETANRRQCRAAWNLRNGGAVLSPHSFRTMQEPQLQL